MFVIEVTTVEMLERIWPGVVPEALVELNQYVEPFRSANSYGLFAVMTTERLEITIEGSEDGKNWKPYRFRWKPGELNRRPRFTTPHMPRLDWQLWFAALVDDCRSAPWFLRFEQKLLVGAPEVLSLLERKSVSEPASAVCSCATGALHVHEPGFTRLVGSRGSRVFLPAESSSDHLIALDDGCPCGSWLLTPCGAIGSERRRTPVALKIALPIAGAIATIGVSPAPAEGRSLRSRSTTSIAGVSRNRGTRYREKRAFVIRPSSYSIASNSAPPIPMTRRLRPGF